MLGRLLIRVAYKMLKMLWGRLRLREYYAIVIMGGWRYLRDRMSDMMLMQLERCSTRVFEGVFESKGVFELARAYVSEEHQK